MAKTYPAYPSAFRAEAVELTRSGGRRILQIARDLGISDQALRSWIKQAYHQAGHGRHG